MVPSLINLAHQPSNTSPISVAPFSAGTASYERLTLIPGHAPPFSRTAHAWLRRPEVSDGHTRTLAFVEFWSRGFLAAQPEALTFI